ncbi:MAG: glycosyltransferase, partial [Proteobacteria bacterium]|nr:glycosyltransferase [Pseudomonadota bacterium]
MQPLVSIGMSVFNCGPTLVPTIRSLLHQTYDNWELILLDDGSTDGTPLLAKAFHDQRIRFIADGLNKGLAARLNQAVDLSRGAYFARM